MQIRDNRGQLIGEINTPFTNRGKVITTNTIYHHGNTVVQNTSVRDNQGEVRTTNVIGGKILP